MENLNMVKVCFTRYVPSSGSRCCYLYMQYSGSLQFCTSHRFSSYNLRSNRPFTLFLYPSILICSTIRYSGQKKCKGKQIFIRHTNRYYSTARFTGNSGQPTILLGPVIPPSPRQGEILQDNINIDVFWVTSIFYHTTIFKSADTERILCYLYNQTKNSDRFVLVQYSCFLLVYVDKIIKYSHFCTMTAQSFLFVYL